MGDEYLTDSYGWPLKAAERALHAQGYRLNDGDAGVNFERGDRAVPAHRPPVHRRDWREEPSYRSAVMRARIGRRLGHKVMAVPAPNTNNGAVHRALALAAAWRTDLISGSGDRENCMWRARRWVGVARALNYARRP